MSERGSRNFILIMLAVLVLWMALSDRKKPRLKATTGWLALVTYPQAKPPHRVFGDLAEVVGRFHVSWSAPGGTKELAASAVEPNFFQLIGVEPVLGRAFETSEDVRDHVVMLSYNMWQRHYHGAAGVVSRTITLDGQAYRVIGILPEDFTWNNRDTDVWMPLHAAGAEKPDLEI